MLLEINILVKFDGEETLVQALDFCLAEVLSF